MIKEIVLPVKMTYHKETGIDIETKFLYLDVCKEVFDILDYVHWLEEHYLEASKAINDAK